MRALDRREAVPDAPGDRLAGSLHAVTRRAAPAGEAVAGGQLGGDRLPLRARTLRTERVVASLGVVDLAKEIGEPLPILDAGAGVEGRLDGVAAGGPQPQLGEPPPARLAGGRDGRRSRAR